MSLNPNARAFVPGTFSKPLVPPSVRMQQAAAAPVPTESAPAPATPAADPTPAATPEPTLIEKAPEPVSEPAPAPATAPAAPASSSTSEVTSKLAAASLDDEVDGDQVALADEVVEEEDPREHINIVFIGHVDAGKSTISGNILYLTGQVDKRTIEKYEREAKEKNRGTWFLAYIMDTNEEERTRGKTVEVGRAHFETPSKRYTILDAPGHKNYVPNMIGGAAQADVAILVISAKTGEFESGFDKGGQTREHAMLVKTLGVKHLIVAINKMDEPQIKWSKERYDDIAKKLSEFLKKEAQWAPKDTYFLPVSGYSGLNLNSPVSKEDCPWWEGRTLFQYLDELNLGERGQSDALRIPVMDKYKEAGVLNILGKVESGAVSRGQQVYVLPNKIVAKTVGVYIAEKPVKRAKTGENVRICVTGLEEADVSTGFVICGINNYIRAVTEFTAQIVILELMPTNPLFTAGYEAILHVHTAVRECQVVELLSEIDKKTRKPTKRKPMFVKDGGVVIAKFQTTLPVCIETFAEFPQLGRFTLRDKGKTIAIGKVTKIDK